MERANRPFTAQDADYCFRRAVCSMSGAEERWRDRATRRMTDAEVSDALRFELGIEGGGTGPDRPDYHYSGSGLRIWGAWTGLRPSVTKPLWAGADTVRKARSFFGIGLPLDDRQMSLFDVS